MQTALCYSTLLDVEDLRGAMYCSDGKIQLYTGPVYGRHQHLVLSMEECRFTLPYSPSHTSPFLSHHPSRTEPFLVCFWICMLAIALSLALSQAWDGCVATMELCRA